MSDALLEAIQTRNVERLANLLASGSSPNEPGKSRYGDDDEYPLHAAIGELEAFDDEPAGPIDAVVLLLRYGARVDGWDVSKEGDPLLIAVKMPHMEAVRILLAARANPNIRDDEGDSPLRICADNGHLDMARLLLQCGANKTIHEAGGAAGMNALGLAAYGLRVELVRLLLAYGADPYVEDADRMTVFDHLRHVPLPDPAARERLREIRRLLGDPALTDPV